MRVGVIGKDKPERNFIVVANADTVVIPIGSPLVFAINGTQDGLAVVLPSTAGAALSANCPAGIANGTSFPLNQEPIGLGDMVQIAGICNYTLISFTRAASTNTWAASTLSLGDVLSIDTVNNALAYLTHGTAQTINPSAFALAQSTVVASQASTFGGTLTVTSLTLKTFLRVM